MMDNNDDITAEEEKEEEDYYSSVHDDEEDGDDDDDPTVPLAELVELDDDDDDDDDVEEVKAEAAKEEGGEEGEDKQQQQQQRVALSSAASSAAASPPSSVHLAGFAAAAPSSSPSSMGNKKQGPRAWQLFSGWGNATTATAGAPSSSTTTTTPAIVPATSTPAKMTGSAAAAAATTKTLSPWSTKLTTEVESKSTAVTSAAGKFAITPAAEAVMDAIFTTATNNNNSNTNSNNNDNITAGVTATLMDMDAEEKEDEGIDEVMRTLRQDHDNDNNNNDDDEGRRGEEDEDPMEYAARKQAEQLNRDALFTTYESNYKSLQKENDMLRKRLSEKESEIINYVNEVSKVQSNLDKAQLALQQKVDATSSLQNMYQSERTNHDTTKSELLCATERSDRLLREADHLRSEISRLSQSNAEHVSLLSSMTNAHSRSTSETMPLRLQIRRLEQELDAMTSHSNYLDGELTIKSDSITTLKREHSIEVRSLRSELDQVRITLEQTERDLSTTKLISNRTQQELERMQSKLYNSQLEYNTRIELLEVDLYKERELVSMKDQRVLLIEDQNNVLTRQMNELRQLAQEANEEKITLMNETQSNWNKIIEDTVQSVRDEEKKKLDDVEAQLHDALEARARMEANIMNSNSGSTPRRRQRLGEGGNSTSPMRLLEDDSASGGGDSEPLGLTDLYSRLADTEDDLRTERRENQKLLLILDKVQRDVAAKTPIIRQWQMEHESALEELDVMNERLHFARREVTDVRADNQELESMNSRLERECVELRRENVDLATQIQSLLQRQAAKSVEDVVSFNDIASLQEQNQKLLRNFHFMSDKIAELEDKITNDPYRVELTALRTEVGTLRDEREKQTTLVAGIVHQRDLYRALVAKNDAYLIDGQQTGQDQLALVDARAEQLPLIEARNHDLVEEVAKLKAEVSCFKYEQSALEGRLARVDSHANELSTSNERMREDLTTAKATVARLEIDVSHYQGQIERLENSLGMVKSECESAIRRKAQVDVLLSNTQTHLETARGELAKKEQQYQQASSKMRLLAVQLETSTANEKRIESEASALRAEIARQETLLSSVQRIEASLVAKAEGELENLQEELKRVQELKSDDAKRYDVAIQKLEGKTAELELSVKDLTTQKEAATASATKATMDCSKLTIQVQQLTKDLNTAEKELKAAKIKLGDVTIDTSAEEALEAKVTSLTNELESTKVELTTVQTRVADYQAIAKSSEEQLAELTTASTKYKDETTITIKRLRELEKSQCETVAELTKDLMSHRSEKEKAINELKATIDSLTSQLVGAKSDATKAMSRTESLIAEAKRYQLDAKNANVNYERELALHAEARTALRDTRSEMESEQRLRETVESQLATAQAEIETEKMAWETSKMKLEGSLSEAKSRLDDMRSQNALLHDQMASLSATVVKFQSTKASALMEGESLGDGSVDNADATGAVVDKQLSDLRELLRFKQSECAMLEADLASAKRASERERIAAESAKRILEETRSELKVLRDAGTDEVSGASAKEVDDIRAKLSSAEEQLLLLRESNTMLREESQKVSKRLSEAQSQLNALKLSTAPQMEKMKSMEVERASLEAEKESLSREVDAWKNRVHNLVSKFNQIDPEDYAQALITVDKMKGECALLKEQKELSDANTAKAEGLVARLKKEIESQKASITAFKNALEKTKKEKEELSKASSSNKQANMKIAAAQATTKKTEEDLTAAKAEVVLLTSRLENFKKMMLKMQAGLRDAKVKEDKATETEKSLQKAIADLKGKLDATNTTTNMQLDTANKVVVMAAESNEGVEKTQPVDQTNATNMTIATTTATEEEGETTSTASDAAIPGKKKGKKRKATPPKKNAASGEEVEIVDAPAQKKAAAQPSSVEKVTTTAADTKSAVNVPPQQKKPIQVKKAPPQKKVISQTAATKQEDSSVKAVPDAEIVKAANEQKTPTLTIKNAPQKRVAVLAVAAALTDTPAIEAEPVAEKTSVPDGKELEMKMKLELLKKRKAAALAKKMESEKQMAEQDDSSSKPNESSSTSSTVAAVENSEIAKAEARRLRFSKPLGTGRDDVDEIAKAEPTKDDDTTSGDQPTLVMPPLTFGGTPPDDSPPKPSFFGGGGMTTATSSTSIFGSAATAPSSFSPFGAPPAATTTAAPPLPPSIGGSSGAFLNLTPPGGSAGVSNTPSKFVFGKSANITLAIPTGTSPMVSAKQTLSSTFGKASPFSSTPFGGGFGGPPTLAFGTSPFGGGGGGGDEAGEGMASTNKRPATSDEGGQPDEKKLRIGQEEEGEEEEEDVEEEGEVGETVE